MTSFQLAPSFEAPRPQKHQGILSSPNESPRLQRPSSQASMHYPPVSAATTYSPVQHGDVQAITPFAPTHAQPYRSYQANTLSLPLPHSNFVGGGYPSTAPPLASYPNPGNAFYGGQPMIRTVSHAHPLHSATDHTASTRYSASPHSTSHALDAPPTASAVYSMSINPPAFTMQGSEERHVNPSIFNPSYPMSRSTSGASDAAGDTTRLLTPHLDFRNDYLSPNEQELRKVSDSLGRPRFYQHQSAGGLSGGGFDMTQGLGLDPHPQPNGFFFNRTVAGDHFALSAERGDAKPPFSSFQAETEYERQREHNIQDNQKLLENLGVGGGGGHASYSRSRNASHAHGHRKTSSARRRVLTQERPVRMSSRIASMGQNVSYADLDGGPPSDLEEDEEDEEDQYASDQDMEEDDFRLVKRTKGAKRSYGRQVSYSQKPSRKIELSLYGLLQVYPEIPHSFPLFYYTLNNDLTINSDSVPLIGSIPSTCTPIEKADTLRQFFHRGRRVLAQLDAFASRCDRKFENADEKWPELDFDTRVAVRDVRRKVVERCENYKYTRRDILDKVLGKNKWQPIEHGLVEWKAGVTEGDPANDLANVTLTLPTPPIHMYAAQQAQTQRHASQSTYPGRVIRPFPARSRVASAAPRTISVNMGSPDRQAYPHTAMSMPTAQGYGYAPQPPAPMYGEDQVAMSVQMPGVREAVAQGMATSSTMTALPTGWGADAAQGIKRARSDDESDNGSQGDHNSEGSFA